MTFAPERIYALDIETDNSPGRDGLDPANSSVTEVCVVTDPAVADGGIYLSVADLIVDGWPEARAEGALLDRLQGFLAGLEPGLIVTWNGTFFDFPFINDRILPSGASLLNGLRLDPAPTLRPKYEALPGHGTPDNPGGGYQVTWEISREFGLAHSHLDVAQAYRRHADDNGIKWGLKPVADHLDVPGFTCPPGFTDLNDFRQRLHDASPEQRKAYNLSDGLRTRALALRLLGLDYAPYN